MVDCAGPCKKDCDIFNLTLASDTAGFQGYAFNFKDVKLVKEEPAYTLQLTTSDGFTDERTVSIGDQSWIDGVKFKVEDGGESFMILTARIDKQLSGRAGNASIKTIGGLSCVQTGGGICTRSYKGYNITMINRIDGGGVRFNIRKPDGLDVIGTAYQNGTTYLLIGHEGIIVGVLNYMIPGGYSNIWVKMR